MGALFRLSRAAVVAVVTVFLAAAAHVAGGGALPDPLIAAGLLALTLLPVIALSGKRITPAAMLGILGSGQFALHGAFAGLSESATTAPALAPAAGHVHVLGAFSSPLAGGHGHTESAAMLTAHFLATLATGVLLARGEAALWALLSWLRPLLRLLAALAPRPTPAVPAFTEETLPRLWRGLRLPALRGPPTISAVA
jgi:hypothetical protein